MHIKGEGLYIENMSAETGELLVKGRMLALSYTDGVRPTGVLKRLLKMSGIPAETLLLCLVCGVLLGFVFAVLEFLRLLFSLGKIAAAVTDVLFCLFAAVATFFAVPCGQRRARALFSDRLRSHRLFMRAGHGDARHLPLFCRMQSAACTALETEFLQNTRKDGGKRWKHC